MIISRYFLSESNNTEAKAVCDTMALFGVSQDKSLIPENVSLSDWLPKDAIFVKNDIIENDMVRICTEFTFWSDDGQLDSIRHERSAYKQTEIPVSVFKRLIGLNIFLAMRQITGNNPSPWGILRGVRPTKIVHKLLDQGFSVNDTVDIMETNYEVQHSKAQLTAEVAVRQRSLLARLGQSRNAVSVYIGIPFCPSRCLYCSFPSYVLPDNVKMNNFLNALQKDIKMAQALVKSFNLVVDSIYIGGGTPTSLNCEHLDWLLSLIKDSFITDNTREFTVEAGRPDSIDNDKLCVLSKYAVSRISVNPQSMQQKTLNLIGRKHSVQDIIDIFGKIRQLNIPVINMDVIAGLPGETEMDIIDSMEQIASLGPDNLTVHTLALKKGSILKSEILDSGNATKLCSVHNIQRMLDIAGEYAKKMGMKPYYLYRQKHMMDNLENIGYARPGTECFYNINIMEERQTIIGIGPAAGTKAVNTDTWVLKSCYNAKDLQSYISNVEAYTKTRQQLLAELFSQYKGES